MTPDQIAVFKSTIKVVSRYLEAKNCGTGPGGFQPGNTCGRRGGGNSAEGSARRKRSGKRRRQRGPQTGVGAASRRARRRRAGRKNASRRKWKERIDRTGSKNEQILYKRQKTERKDLADTIKAERKEARSDEKASRKDLAKELKTERRESRRDQSKERAKLKRDQEKEVAKETRDFDKREASLDAKYEAAKPKAKDPAALDENYRERKQELAAERAERMQDLSDEHWQARKDLRDSHKIDRENERAEHQSRVEDLKNDQRTARFNDHLSHKEQAYDLNESHRAERAEELRDLRLPDDDKALGDLETKANSDAEPSTPTADAILRAALSTTGHTDAWEAGTLSDEGAMELLHQIRMDARAWFRAEAQAVLDEVTGLEAKALFGDAKAKVGAFFNKAKKHVREIIAAGILAVAGPGPVLQQEAIADPYREQVEIQAEYLADFRKQILAGDKPLDGTFVSRAEMYGSAAWTAPQTIFRVAAKNSKVFNFEWREHLGPRTPTDPCSVCDSQEKQGRKPIGTLKAIGDSPCKCNCHCTFFFSVTADGPGYACGRGPLFEPAFGVTG